jgi:uncharacterized protein
MNTANFGLTDEDMETILAIFSKYPQIEKAVIYGSRARGNYKRGSDVDIALTGDLEEVLWQISAELNEETLMPYKFDIKHLDKHMNIELNEEIKKYGKLIFSNPITV